MLFEYISKNNIRALSLIYVLFRHGILQEVHSQEGRKRIAIGKIRVVKMVCRSRIITPHHIVGCLVFARQGASHEEVRQK
jgi:ribosomal protein S19